MNKKKAMMILSVFILIIPIIFAGCSGDSYMTSMCSEKNTNNSWVMSYASFSGTKSIPLDVKKGDIIQLYIYVDTKEGNLEVSALNQKGNVLYKVDTPKKAIYQVLAVTENTTYTFQVKGKHKGGFLMNWHILHPQYNKMPLSSFAKGKSVNISVTGEPISQKGVIVEDMVLVPVRVASDALKTKVVWDGASQKITLTKKLYYVDLFTKAESIKTRTIILWIGKKKALVDGKTTSLHIAPQFMDGKTMIPARDVLKRLDTMLEWDSRSNTFDITPAYHESFKDNQFANTVLSNDVERVAKDGWINMKDLKEFNTAFNINPKLGPIGFYYVYDKTFGPLDYEVSDFDGDYGKSTSVKSSGGNSTYDFNGVYDDIRMRGSNSSIEFNIQDLINIIIRC